MPKSTHRKRKQNKNEETFVNNAANKRCKTGEQPEKNGNSTTMPKVGERVAIYWPKNDEYYPGVIINTRPRGRVYIQYDDGDEQWVQLSKVCYLVLADPSLDQRADNPKISDLRIGCRVSVWWQTEERFYDGTLKKIKNSSPTSPHRIFYDDGDKEWTNLAFRRFRCPGADAKSKVKGEPKK